MPGRKIQHYLYILLLLSILTSCVTRKKTNYLQEPGKGIPAYPVAEYKEYRLLQGDELNIYIFSLNEETNSLFNQGISLSSGTNINQNEKSIYTYTIYNDGSIDYPVVGKVYMQGRTLREAEAFLKDQLKEQFIADKFYVTIKLVNNNFSIISDAGSGKYEIVKEQMTIFQAIAASRDLADYADRAHVKIIRPTQNGTEIKEFDIRSKDLLASEFYYVKPNDVIYVQSYKGQFFRFESFGTILATIMTTITLGLFVKQIGGF